MSEAPGLRAELERRDRQNRKKGQDVELDPARGDSPRARLILTDTATGTRYEVKVTAGALVLAALPYA